MNLHRIIWLGYFTFGLFVLGLCLMALDGWAMSVALPGSESFCQGTLAGEIPITRAPLCFAIWFVEAKSWLIYARDMLLQLRHGGYLREFLRTGDVAMFAIGGVAMMAALAWVWADAMTRVTCSAVASSYLLMHAVANLTAGRSRHA